MAKKYKTTFLFFVAALLISFLISISSVSFPKNIVLDLSKIPLRLITLSFLPVESIINCNRSLRELSRLKLENQKLKIMLMQLKEAEAENIRLKKLLSFKQESGLFLIAARVIGSDASNFKRTLVINKGRTHGIKLGNPVITDEGVVGTVVELGNFASRILLINDPDFSMAGKVRRSNVAGIVSGSLEGICKFKYLDLNDDIKAGDEIISLGADSRFPAGLSAGEVTSISKDSSGLTVVALFRPKVRLSSMQEVLVITNY